jgi:hypothetical protein
MKIFVLIDCLKIKFEVTFSFRRHKRVGKFLIYYYFIEKEPKIQNLVMFLQVTDVQ